MAVWNSFVRAKCPKISVHCYKTTRQLSKTDPYVGGLEGGVTPTGFYSRPQVAAPALSNRGLGGDPPEYGLPSTINPEFGIAEH
jgi:hypothetical protein